VLQDLMNKPEVECTVFSHKITFETKRFELKFLNIPHRSKVKVIKNIWKWKDGIATISWENKLYDVQCTEQLPRELGGFSAHAAIIGQEYKAQPETATQKGVKRIETIAYETIVPADATPEERAKIVKGAVPFSGTKVFGGFADKIGNLATLPKQGTPIEMAREAAAPAIPIIEFLKRLRSEIGSITPALNREIRDTYGDHIDASEASRVISRLAVGEPMAEPGTGNVQNL
jgi:hypothetical protein